MNFLICGAPVYDYTAVSRRPFSFASGAPPEQLLVPCDQEVLLARFTKKYGGCAFNAAHNFKLLRQHPIIVAAVGTSFTPDYAGHCRARGLDTTYIQSSDSLENCAVCLNLTDQEGRECFFHTPGPVFNDISLFKRAIDDSGATLAIVSSDRSENMAYFANELQTQEVPYLLAPGPDLFLFELNRLKHALIGSSYLHLNLKEWKYLTESFGGDLFQWCEKLELIVITLGADGSESLQRDGQKFRVAAMDNLHNRDPIGCGDAHVAGFFTGLQNGYSPPDALALGNVLAAFNLEHFGTQTHDPDPALIIERARTAYHLDVTRLFD